MFLRILLGVLVLLTGIIFVLRLIARRKILCQTINIYTYTYVHTIFSCIEKKIAFEYFGPELNIFTQYIEVSR